MGPSYPLSIPMLFSLSDDKQGGISLCNSNIHDMSLPISSTASLCHVHFFFFFNVAVVELTGYKSWDLFQIFASSPFFLSRRGAEVQREINC